MRKWENAHLDDNEILANFQHGFRKGYSCETQPISVVERISRNLGLGFHTDVLLLDFSKAFDSVPHQRLLMKLRNYDISGNLNQ